jgi:hypothetical protein
MFAMIVVALGLTLTLAFILIGVDIRSDLSDLKPMQAMADQAKPLIGWPDLEIKDGRPASAELSGRRIRMLGYMMDGYKPSPDGAQVKMFILMPEAGHFLHPAHRIPNEMVEIWLRLPAPFKYRSLVRATGLLARNPSGHDCDKASYVMQDAETEPALERDITRWFKP